MYTTYLSPVFKNADGSQRIVRVPVESLSTWVLRDACLAQMMALGGIHAHPTPEFMKLRAKMMSAKRKIEKNGWHSTAV